MPSELPAAARTGTRLHPVSLLFSIGSAAWKLLLPGILLLVFASRGRNLEIWLMVLFAPAVIAAVAKYLSFRYRLGDDELVIREGILTRNERHIPYARIQNIDLVQNPFHRLLSVAQIRIETAGGEEPEANIQVLSLEAVEQMRSRVFAGRPERVGGTAPGAFPAAPGPASGPAPGAVPETGSAASGVGGAALEPARAAVIGKRSVLLQLSPKDLVLFGIISNRGMALVLAVFGLAWQAQWQGWAPEWTESLIEPISKENLRSLVSDTSYSWASPLMVAALLIGGVLAALALLRLISVVWAFVKLYGFTLTRAGEDLRTSFGLFTRRSATIPRHRIQLLTFRETLTQRLFGRMEVRVETAGSGKKDEDSGVSRQLLVPLITPGNVGALLEEVQPEIDLESLEWKKVDPRGWRRILKKVVAATIVLAGAATFFIGFWAWVAWVVALPPVILSARMRFNRMAYAVAPGCVAYRSGWWVRHLSVARFTKIQVVDLGRNPFDRRWGMATVRVDTAGAGHSGHRIRVPYLGLDLARGVFERLSMEAARAEFRW